MSVAEMIARDDPTKGAQLTIDETVVLGEYIVHIETENAELKRKLDEHNKECDTLCSNKTDCYKRGYKQTCHDCPKDWRIDL
jgi:hypothetical protein